MSWTESAGAARALFPSLGYFGSLISDCLIVPVWQRIRYLKLSLDDDTPSVLSLRGIQLYRDGLPLRFDSADVRLRQSSVYESNPSWGPDSVLTLSGNHTDWESHPWWEMSLTSPRHVNRLCIYNRSDAWGYRAFSIRVDIETASGDHRVLYRGSSADAFAAQLVRVIAIAGSIDAVAGDDEASADRMRQVIIERIVGRIRRGELAPSETPWLTIVPLIAIGEHQPLTLDETTLLASAILGARSDESTPSLRLFEACLESETSRALLEEELDSIASRYGVECIPKTTVTSSLSLRTR